MPGDWWWIASCWLVTTSGFLLVLWVLLRVLTGIWQCRRLREIVLARDEQYDLINVCEESPVETAKKHGLTWLPVTSENKGYFLLPLTGGVLHFVPVYYGTDTVAPGDPPWQVPIFQPEPPF